MGEKQERLDVQNHMQQKYWEASDKSVHCPEPGLIHNMIDVVLHQKLCWAEISWASMVYFIVPLLYEAPPSNENGFTVDEGPMENRDFCLVSVWVSP